MKKILPIFLFCVPFLSFSQNQFATDFASVKKELSSWDEVRGEWLAKSLESMVYNKAIPQRTFPEQFTPFQMLKMVPKEKREQIYVQIETNERNSNESAHRIAWNELKNTFNKVDCTPRKARSYGDPHLSSFDDASFSFQTVGEFVLSKSSSKKFEVQSRQSPQKEDFSLNTAIAMNVGGDRVCIYRNETPDQFSNSPVRLNGQVIEVGEGTYFLPNGGTIRMQKRHYIVDWPTGEIATISAHSSSLNFFNVDVQIYPCSDETYEGVLGNANRNPRDDFNVGTRMPNSTFISAMAFGNDRKEVEQQIEKENLAYIAREFGNYWRVTNETTLFDYGFGKNTMSYTDFRFPIVHRTLRDMTPQRRDASRTACQNQGLIGAELDACIYDRGFLEIEHTPRPVIEDRTKDVVLARIEKKIPVKEVEEPITTPTKRDNEKLEKTEVKDRSFEEEPVAKPISKSEPDVKQEKTKVVFPDFKTNGSSGKTKTTPTKVSSPTKTSTPVKTTTPVKVNTPTKVITPTGKRGG